jgi:type IV pilus assembly protein PilV
MTLIEVVLALLILAVVSLALMQTTLVAYQENMKNILRDEAVSVAEEKMIELRNRTFTQTVTDPLLQQTLSTGVTYTAVQRTVRSSMGQFPFTPTRYVSDVNPDSKQVTMKVAWKWKGKDYSHSITTIVRRQ